MTSVYLVDAKLIDNPEIVMFDKDGTLIDIHHYWGSMIKLRAERIIERYFAKNPMANEIQIQMIDAMGVNLNSGNLKPEGPVGVMPRPFIINVLSQVSKSWGMFLNAVDIEKVFLEIDEETSKNLLPLLRILPGVEILLDELKKNKIPIALVSTDITSRAVAAIRALQLDNFFDLILGGDSVTKTKPHPDLAIAALAYFSASPEKAIVIGDHPVDIMMGLNAGCKVNIGVLNGISTVESFDIADCIKVKNLTQITVQ